MTTLQQMGQKAKAAAGTLAVLDSKTKDDALRTMAQRLEDDQDTILAANGADVAAAKEAGMRPALIDRLALSADRLRGMADGLRDVAALSDPIGEVLEGSRRPNGLRIQKVRVPLGVVGMIYEARPNVTADAAALCFKAGNAVILRGGKEAIRSNRAIAAALRSGLTQSGLSPDAIQLVENTDRENAREMMELTDYLDVLIPRGGAGLIQAVVQQARVPVLETGTGNCHIYVDETADIAMAARIVVNAKASRPSVCNAAEKLLIHSAIAPTALPVIADALLEQGVELRGCPRAIALLPGRPVREATAQDWPTEYLDTILAIKIVDSLDEAIGHITAYGSGHSECIVTDSQSRAQTFTAAVDAAAVYVNASTRFTDGAQFGYGAEIGISTQKLHARGPMGLRELTSTKYIVIGDGQIR